jgi:uncharacterized protein with HEPN domain
MSRHDDQAYIEHIGSSADSIQSYVQGMTFDTFAAARKAQHAVLYEIAVIGEAAFKTLKHQPTFPKRSACQVDACR